jgi:hypothetical protein
MDLSTQQKLLTFATGNCSFRAHFHALNCTIPGSRKAPIGGLKNLNFKIQRMGPDRCHLSLRLLMLDRSAQRSLAHLPHVLQYAAATGVQLRRETQGSLVHCCVRVRGLRTQVVYHVNAWNACGAYGICSLINVSTHELPCRSAYSYPRTCLRLAHALGAAEELHTAARSRVYAEGTLVAPRHCRTPLATCRRLSQRL